MSQPATLETLWYTRCPVPTGLGIAVQQGWLSDYFAADNIVVKSLRESNDKAVRDSHFDHTLPNSVRHGGSIPAIWAFSSGRPTKVVGLSWADEVQLLLTRQDSGIRHLEQLKGRRFGIPNNTQALIDFSRAQAIRGLENSLKLVGLAVSDLTLVDTVQPNLPAQQQPDSKGGTPYASEQKGVEQNVAQNHLAQASQTIAGTQTFGDRQNAGRNAELVALLRGDVDAIFLKGAHAAQIAQDFGLHVIFDVGLHPDPLVRSNNGTPRTLTVDANLLQRHFDSVIGIVTQVLHAEQWAWQHPEQTRQYLARESNTSEYWVTQAYGEDAHLRLRTDFNPTAIAALQDLSDFLYRWNFIPAAIDVNTWIDSRAFVQAEQLIQLDKQDVPA